MRELQSKTTKFDNAREKDYDSKSNFSEENNIDGRYKIFDEIEIR